MQQMMLMKMMSANQSSALAPPSVTSDKRTFSSNGDEEDMENTSANGDLEDDDRPKQLLCEPEIELSERDPKMAANFFEKHAHAREENSEEEDKSRHSEQSNQAEASADWSSGDWKMSFKLCEGGDISPEELQQHIKAHLQAAMSSAAGEEKCAPDSAADKTAFHANGQSLASP